MASRVKHMLDDVSQAKETAEGDRETASRELDEARRESYAIRAEAREIAGSERERLLDEARAEGEALIERTHCEIAQSVEHARETLRGDLAALAVEVAEKVLRSELTDEQQRKATTVYLEEATTAWSGGHGH
jgi:F-type H+-transporting ATPase subunit b